MQVEAYMNENILHSLANVFDKIWKQFDPTVNICEKMHYISLVKTALPEFINETDYMK